MERLKWMLLLAGVIWLAGCGEVNQRRDFVAYSSDAIGLSFDYPPSWVVNEEGVEMITASSQAVIDSADYADGAAVILFVEPASRIGSDLTKFLEEQVVAEAGTAVVEPPSSTRINGNRAASVLIANSQGDSDLLVGTTVIAGGTDVAFVLTLYDSAQASQYAPLVEAITESVTFVE